MLVREVIRWDETISDYRYTNFVINPSTLEKNIEQTEDNTTILNSNDLGKTKTCFSYSSGCIENKADLDTNGSNTISFQDLQHLFLVQEGTESRFAYISDQEQINPVISPDDNWIAYIQRKKIKNNCGYTSYVEGISITRSDGAIQKQVKGFDGWYRNLSWSPDGNFGSLGTQGVDSISGVISGNADSQTSQATIGETGCPLA